MHNTPPKVPKSYTITNTNHNTPQTTKNKPKKKTQTKHKEHTNPVDVSRPRYVPDELVQGRSGMRRRPQLAVYERREGVGSRGRSAQRPQPEGE